jgi:hypothetical protein
MRYDPGHLFEHCGGLTSSGDAVLMSNGTAVWTSKTVNAGIDVAPAFGIAVE